MRPRRYAGTTCWLSLFLSVGCSVSPAPVQAPEPAQEERFAQLNDVEGNLTVWDGVFTAEQAIRGRRAASENCIGCHPPGDWSRPTFLDGWGGGRPLGDLYVKISRTMPQDDPGRLSPEAYADIVAYMLQLHDAPAGGAQLPSSIEVLDRILVTPAQNR